MENKRTYLYFWIKAGILGRESMFYMSSYIHHWILFSHKENKIMSFTKKKDGTGDHKAEWDKPSSKSQYWVFSLIVESRPKMMTWQQ
jgi:hypothetical protein